MLHRKFKSLRLMLLVFLTTTLLMNYVLINAYIPSGSMENTIMTGDRIIGEISWSSQIRTAAAII